MTEENTSVSLSPTTTTTSENPTSNGFNVEKIPYPKFDMIIFTIKKSISDKDFVKFLDLLDKLLNTKKPFTLLVDTRQCSGVPIKASIMLISWMKKRKPDIPGVLLGSTVVINSQIIVGLVNSAFKIQKPTSPNLMTNDYNKSKAFLEKL